MALGVIPNELAKQLTRLEAVVLVSYSVPFLSQAQVWEEEYLVSVQVAFGQEIRMLFDCPVPMPVHAGNNPVSWLGHPPVQPLAAKASSYLGLTELTRPVERLLQFFSLPLPDC